MKLSRLPVTAVLAAALVASGCSASSEPEEATESTTQFGAVDEAEAEMAFTETTVAADEAGADEEPASIEEYEARWAERRAEIIETLSADEYGVGDDGLLRGPGGFEIDLAECPQDWSDTAGVDDDTITIGYTLPQTGPLAAAGNLGVGMQVYFDYVNANGGVDGRSVQLVVKDDSYDAAETIVLVDELLEEGVFSIGNLGSSNTLRVYDKVNRFCVPQPFAVTGHPALGDPANHPWTTGLQIAYGTEAILWGNWIKQNLSDELPVTVTALAMDNDFGTAYEAAFKAWAEANPDVISELLVVPHNPASVELSEEMATVAASDPDVYVSMTVGNACLLAIEEAAATGLTESAAALFTPSVCKDPNSYLIPAGDAADGFLMAGGGTKATSDPQWADEVFVQFVNEQLEAAGRDTSVSYYGEGFAFYGWTYVEALRIAAELPGGLSRTNLILAVRALDLEHPILLDGISFATNGNEDAYFIEGTEFSQFDASSGSWVQLGNVIDLNGSSPTCSWVTGRGC